MYHRSLWLGSLILLAGCSSSAEKSYTLPAGNAERGKEAFVAFRCYDCHQVSGVDMPVGEEPNQALVNLGGEVPRIKTYGELVTAIVNPSHKLAAGYTEALVSRNGQSKMTVYNDVMTVTQLVDIVAFLQSHYKLQPYEPTDYPIYMP